MKRTHTAYFVLIAAFAATAHASICNPFSVFKIDCNTCMCAADGNNYQCSENDCDMERLIADEKENDLIPYGNDALPAEADVGMQGPSYEHEYPQNNDEVPEFQLLDDAPKEYYKNEESNQNQNNFVNVDDDNNDEENFIDSNNKNDKNNEEDDKDTVAIELDKNAYVVEDPETGKAYVIESFDKNADIRKKRSAYEYLEADDVIIDQDPETGKDVNIVPLEQ